MVADFDFRGLADILGTHIGFLKANSKVKVFTYAGEFVDEPLCIAISECVSNAASSSKRMSRARTVLTLVLALRRATLREFIVGTGMKVHTISGRVKGIGQEGREEDSKECRG